MIRVLLPAQLRKLAESHGEVQVEVEGDVTIASVIDALEAAHPALRGTIRDQVTRKRRPFIRFYGDEEDLSHEPPDSLLPEVIRSGSQPLVVIGAMSGG